MRAVCITVAARANSCLTIYIVLAAIIIDVVFLANDADAPHRFLVYDWLRSVEGKTPVPAKRL